MRVAVIPARGGSKRIPRKNIKDFCGKPMIAWSIEATQKSGCFDEVIVSTDDDEVADVARFYGASAPFKRPSELADDHAGTTAVLAHAIGWFNTNGMFPEHVCCVYATAPLVHASDISAGLKVLLSKKCDYVFSVTTYASPIQRAFRINGEGRIEMFDPKKFDVRSQDLDEAWHDAGQFYWGTAQAWLAKKTIFSQGSIPLALPRYRVQDIDSQDDWVRAEYLFRAINAQYGDTTSMDTGIRNDI